MKTRHRIAIVIDRIVRWDGAGTEHHLAQVLACLDRSQFEPAVFVFEPSLQPFPENLDFPIVLIPPGDPRRHAALLWNLTTSLRRFRPDIVQLFFRDATYLGSVASHLARVPTVILSKRDVGEPDAWWEFPATRLLGRMSDRWVCNSSSVRDWVLSKRWAKADQITILSNCVDLNHFRPPLPSERSAFRKRIGLPLEAPVLVSVANLRAVKGLDTVLEAAHIVVSKNAEAQFYIIGEGPEREHLRSKIRSLRLEKSVILVGPQNDVAPWLMAADIGLLASYREGSSNALLEYMASGLPSVVSSIPANLELVDDVLFPPGDAEKLGQRILNLWDDVTFRQELGWKYRASAMKFGTDEFTQEINRFYGGFLSTNSGSACESNPDK